MVLGFKDFATIVTTGQVIIKETIQLQNIFCILRVYMSKLLHLRKLRPIHRNGGFSKFSFLHIAAAAHLTALCARAPKYTVSCLVFDSATNCKFCCAHPQSYSSSTLAFGFLRHFEGDLSESASICSRDHQGLLHI